MGGDAGRDRTVWPRVVVVVRRHRKQSGRSDSGCSRSKPKSAGFTTATSTPSSSSSCSASCDKTRRAGRILSMLTTTAPPFSRYSYGCGRRTDITADAPASPGVKTREAKSMLDVRRGCVIPVSTHVKQRVGAKHIDFGTRCAEKAIHDIVNKSPKREAAEDCVCVPKRATG
jgi:hypothetical protein